MTTSDDTDRLRSANIVGFRARRRESLVERELIRPSAVGPSIPGSAPERREVGWLDPLGGGCALSGLSPAWRRRPVVPPLSGPWPDLGSVRVAVLNLEGALPRRVFEFIERNQHVKWIALISAETLADAQARDFVGAFCYDFHTLPLDHARLETTLGRAYGMAALEARSALQTRPAELAAETPMIGQSPAMVRLEQLVTRVARSDVPVLLRGEVGTGRKLAARSVHRKSPRAGRPFVVVDCSALSPEGMCAELFGDEHTGERRLGRIELAAGGTLLLDAVDTLSPEAQVRLLHMLEEGMAWRIGGLEPVRLDVRLLAASEDRLAAAVDAGRFRADLYYRLNVVELTLPPLRERGADLMRLARFYLERVAAGRPRLRGFSQAAMDAMSRHPWPGNVGELVSRIRRSVTVAEGRLVRPEDLGFDPDAPPAVATPTLAESRSRVERESVERALRQCANNVSRAARQLGIGRVTLYRLLKKHGIDPPGQR